MPPEKPVRSMIPKRLQWLSPRAFGGAAAGAAVAILARLFMAFPGAAAANLMTFALILAGYALGVAFAYSAGRKELLTYILRLREELRLSQDHLMEGAAFRSLGSYLDATAGTTAELLRTLREDGGKLADDTSLAETARKQADLVKTGCDSLESALGPLAGYSLTRPARAPLSINTLMRAAVNLCRHRAEEKNVLFSERYAVVPPVFGAAGRVENALLNVVINAIEAMPHGGGTITVETSHTDGKVVATVRDPGIGIRPEHASRVFDPFFTTRPEKNSRGLGLWATREVLRPIEATIEVNGKPHEGTAVTMTFPAAAPLRAGRTGVVNPPEFNSNTADEKGRRIA
jgi:signal transduction histidine kinase